jgi:hypothetical protein
MYTKAVYEAPNGVPREAKSSLYTDSLILEGFGDTETHDVELISVGKNTKESEPIVRSFNPLTPPVLSVRESIVMNATFGGVEVYYQNVNMGNIIIDIFIDSLGTGEWELFNRTYTSTVGGRITARGANPVETNFGVSVKDPFGNETDIYQKTLKPLYEIEIPSENFADLKLPNDTKWLRTNNPIQHLWDGVYYNGGTNFFATDQGIDPLPKWVSIDFGDKYILSRIKMWKRDLYDEGRVPSKWEVYGSNNPNPDGSWDSWTLIQQFGPPYKPSGLPLGQSTEEDEDVAANGWDYEFIPVPSTGYRYYRLKWLEAPSGENFILIGEMKFWGQPTD